MVKAEWMTDNEYIQSGGERCPHCRKEHCTQVKMLEVDGPTVVQSVFCHECGAEWTDIYQLIGYEKE